MSTVAMLLVALVCAVIAVTRHDRVVDLRARLAQQEAESRRLAAAVSAAQAQVTGATDQCDAAVRDRTRLLVEVRELAAALDQGAHTVAARRIERFLNNRAQGGPR